MKTIYTWTAVVFRIIAVCVALYGCYVMASGIVIASGGSASWHFSWHSIIVRIFVVCIVAAVVIWVLSRPIAGLITRDLDREDPRQ